MVSQEGTPAQASPSSAENPPAAAPDAPARNELTARIDNDFAYHSPTPQKAELHAQARRYVAHVAQIFNNTLPDGREKALALTKLEEAMFWANAAIARNP